MRRRKTRYLWLVDKRTDARCYVRVKRLWRWRGPATTRHGHYVEEGYVTRVVVDYVGVELTLNLWRDDGDRWRLVDV